MAQDSDQTNTNANVRHHSGMRRTGNVLKYASGFDAIAGFVSLTFRSLVLNGKILFGATLFPLWNHLFKQKTEQEIAEEIREQDARKKYGQKERFAYDMEKYGATDEDILKKMKISYSRFYAYLAMLVLEVFLAVFYSRTIFSGGFVTYIWTICAFIGTLAYTCFWGLSNFRLRNRVFLSFASWICNPARWLPKKAFVQGLFALMVIVGLSGGLVKPAHADADFVTSQTASCSPSDSTTGTAASWQAENVFLLPCEKDIFRNLLESVVPGVMPLSEAPIVGSSTFTNGKTALSEAFRIFLNLIIAVGTAGVAWHIINMIVSGAHEGDLIKSKWAGPWSFIKVGWGWGSLMPFFKGYCLIQIMCIYLAMWSDTFGNTLWVHYIDGLMNPDYRGTPVYGINDKVSRLTNAAACWSLNHNYQQNDGFPDNAPHRPWIPTETVDSNYYTTRLNRDSDATIMNAGRTAIDFVSGMLPASFPLMGAKGQNVIDTWDFGSNCGRFSITRSVSYNNPFDFIGNRYSLENAGIQKMGETSQSIISAYIKEMLDGNGGTAGGTDFSGTNSFPAIIKKALGSSSTSLAVGDIPALAADVVASSRSHLALAWEQVNKDTIATLQQNHVIGGNTNQQSEYETEFRNNAIVYGWAMAGSFYMNLSRMQNMVDGELAQNGKLVTADMNVSQPNDSSEVSEEFLSQSPAYANVAVDLHKAIADAINTVNTNSNPLTISDISKSNTDLAGKVGNVPGVTIDINTIGLDNPDSGIGAILGGLSDGAGWLLKNFIEFITGINNDGGGNKLQAMIEFGHNLITLYFMMMALLWVGKAATTANKVAGKVAGFVAGPEGKIAEALTGLMSDGLGKAFGFIMTILNILLLVGIMHAYVLPMIPYIYFTTFVMSELVFVVTSLVAAPLWMLMHMRLDGGNQFVEQQQVAGYAILFNLFMRIPLGMLAYLMSFMIFNAMQLFLALTFYPAVQGGNGHGGPGIIGTLVDMVIMTYLNWQIALRCFGMINTIPNAVTQWMGFHQQMQDHESGQMLGAVAAGMAMHLKTGQQAFDAVRGSGDKEGADSKGGSSGEDTSGEDRAAGAAARKKLTSFMKK